MPSHPLVARLHRLWHHEIWSASLSRERTLRSRGLALLRIVSITLSGLNELKVAARAAALTYSSLLGLGPLVAIVVLISGFALGDRDPALTAKGVNNVISFIAPQVVQYQRAVSDEESHRPNQPELRATRPPAAAGETQAPADPELVKIINDFITHSHSGTAG